MPVPWANSGELLAACSPTWVEILKNILFRRLVISLPCSFIYLTKYKEMGKDYLGEFEELVLTMVGALRDDAYGAAIAEEIETRLRREVNLSAVHVTLYRLEDKGYIKSRFGGATNARGGRRKRIYTITSAGLAMLRNMREARIELWKMIPQLKTSGR